MEIVFHKKTGGQSTISCKRKDGSATWMHSDAFFIMHDLCHYAVETIMGLQKSFYGMLAAGTDINDFELPKERRTVEFTTEAIWTEHIVNLLGIEYNQGEMEMFTDILNKNCDANGVAILRPVIDEAKLGEIRKLFNSLMKQWHLLPEGKTMNLIFKE